MTDEENMTDEEREARLNELRSEYQKIATCKELIAATQASLGELDFAAQCLDNSAKAVRSLTSDIMIPGYHELLDMEAFETPGNYISSLTSSTTSIAGQLASAGQKADEEMEKIAKEIAALL